MAAAVAVAAAVVEVVGIIKKIKRCEYLLTLLQEYFIIICVCFIKLSVSGIDVTKLENDEFY